MANGRLTEQNLTEELPALKRLGHAQHTTIDALAIAAALSQPWADVVLSRAVTTSQLESNLSAANLAERIFEWPAISERPIDYWQQRKSLAWK